MYFFFSFRWNEAIEYSKKALKLCSQKNPRIIGNMLECYEQLIELFVTTKKYEEALKTFEKIKLFNLNSLKAEDVDITNKMFPMTKAHALFNGLMRGLIPPKGKKNKYLSNYIYTFVLLCFQFLFKTPNFL